MRHWIFHPLVFYPLAALIAAAVIVISLRPQAWPHEPEPVTGEVVQGAIILEGEGLNSPDDSPGQNMTVVRDFWGRPEALRIAVLPGQPEPTPAEQGVRILLTPETAMMIDGPPVIVEVNYSPLAINAASGLAVSLQGIGPADWVIQPLLSEAGVARFELPPGIAIDAIGLRAMSDGDDQAYGVEITRIRAIPQPG